MGKTYGNINKMTISERIIILESLRTELKEKLNAGELEHLFIQMKNENAWFTEDFATLSINSIIDNYLDSTKLKSFVEKYKVAQVRESKSIGIVAAGNIPAVSFHDILCVFLSGHSTRLKASSSDSVLIKYFVSLLYTIDNRMKEIIKFAERLNGVDALIATGSDNTVKHFKFYFSEIPSIIRSNRTSVAVLNGDEDRIVLSNFGNDIFTYFGLGCRNVSKVFVPIGYDFTTFFESIEYWNTIQLHHKYNNNYDYNKSILLVNQDKHLDNGFLLVKNSTELVSPLGVLFYEEYDSVAALKEKLQTYDKKIQAIVTNMPEFERAVPIGTVQQPTLDQFADDVNTMNFLLNL